MLKMLIPCLLLLISGCATTSLWHEGIGPEVELISSNNNAQIYLSPDMDKLLVVFNEQNNNKLHHFEINENNDKLLYALNSFYNDELRLRIIETRIKLTHYLKNGALRYPGQDRYELSLSIDFELPVEMVSIINPVDLDNIPPIENKKIAPAKYGLIRSIAEKEYMRKNGNAPCDLILLGWNDNLITNRRKLVLEATDSTCRSKVDGYITVDYDIEKYSHGWENEFNFSRIHVKNSELANLFVFLGDRLQPMPEPIQQCDNNNCRVPSEYHPLFESNRSPIVMSVLESKERLSYNYSWPARIVLTPFAVIFDVVTTPFWFIPYVFMGHSP